MAIKAKKYQIERVRTMMEQMQEQELQKLFVEDSIEKKNVAKRSIISRPNTPTEKELAKQNGEIKVTSSVIPYEEFKSLPKEQKYKLLKGYLSKMKSRVLAERWGVTNSCVHNYTQRMRRFEIGQKQAKMEQKKQETEVLKSDSISPFEVKMIKQLTGDKTQDYLIKLTDFFDETSQIEAEIDIKSMNPIFKTSIKASATMESKQFFEELIANTSGIQGKENFQITVNLREVAK